MPAHNVLVRGALHPHCIDRFEKNPSIQLTNLPDCPLEELKQHLPHCHVLVTRSETNIDAALIDQAPQLKYIVRAAVGVGNIDIKYATEKGVMVINTPGQNTNSAAELTMALLMAMMRKIPQAHAHLKDQQWDRHRFKGAELKGKTLGVVGVGNVGHRVVQFARGFDMNVIAYDPYVATQKFEQLQAFKAESLEELLQKVDILSFHVPLNTETRGMLNSELLKNLKPGALIINTARGGIIDEQALLSAIESAKVAGVAIDTWENEPTPMEKLVRHPHVWCTPHIGANTEEAQFRIGQTVYEQTIKALAGGVVDYPVNLPNLGEVKDRSLQAYALLAERLGMITGKIIGFNPSQLKLVYRGTLADKTTEIVKLGFLKGFLNQIKDGVTSYVNAIQRFEELGIELQQDTDPAFSSYPSALKVTLNGPQQKEFTIGGTVFDDQFARLSLINDFYFELEPTGKFLVIRNADQPGVVGSIGQFLAQNSVNIDSFDLSRNRLGGEAMAIIKIDSPLDRNQLSAITKVQHIRSASYIEL